MRPLDISVVIPYFEAASTVRRAIDSVVVQCPAVREILVVDDGSQCHPFTWANSDPFVRGYRIQHAGPAAARNAGWSNACAQFIAFLDADDEWLPGRTSQLAPLIESAAQFICGDAVRVVDDLVAGRWSDVLPLKPQPTSVALIERNYVCQSTVVMSRSLLDQLGGYDESLPAWEDIDLWYRASLIVEPSYLAEPTVRYHMGAGGLSDDALKMTEGRLQATGRILQRPEFAGVGQRWKRAQLSDALIEYAYAQCRFGSRRIGLGALGRAVRTYPPVLARSKPPRVLRRALFRHARWG